MATHDTTGQQYVAGEELVPDWSGVEITDEPETGNPHEDEGDDE